MFELVDGSSIANSPRLVEGWATGGWLFFFKKEYFLLDSRFSLQFPRMFKTVYQARGFFSARAAAWSTKPSITKSAVDVLARRGVTLNFFLLLQDCVRTRLFIATTCPQVICAITPDIYAKYAINAIYEAICSICDISNI